MAVGTCYSHHYSLLVLADWPSEGSIVKCRTTHWLLVNLCCFPCKDEGDLFWRCLQFPPYPCSMPSNPKRCKSLRGVLLNSGDMVLHHFANYWPRSWPTKMPTRMLNGLQSCKDWRSSALLKGIIECSSSPNARNTEFPPGSPTNCGNHAWIGCCSKFASLASIHITILPLKNNLWSGAVCGAHCRTGLATIALAANL